jgi:hypothetical protein
MKISKALTAVAACAMVLGLAIPASAAGLTNVISSGTTSVTGTIDSHTTSWDQYAGAQITVSETSSSSKALGADLSGLNPNSALAGNANLYGTGSQDFAAQANITFFRGGDSSDTHITGAFNQVTTQFSTGVQTSFGN